MSLSSDEDIIEDIDVLAEVAQSRRTKTFKPRINPFEEYDDTDFFRHYRFEKTIASYIIDVVREHITSPSNRSGALSAEIIALTAIRYLAAGSYQKDVADCHNISQQSVSNCVKKFVRALASKASQFITFPSDPAALRQVKRKFFNIVGFPQCVGAIDCTHVKIKNPGQEFGARHRCRKNFYSINVQIICDADQFITDIVARWRGSAHDSRIWRQSSIYHRLQHMNLQGGIILGDGGYPASKIMLTPFRIYLLHFLNQRGAIMRHIIRTRNHIERLFGQLKNKFRCCFNGIQLNYETAKASLVAISILHNISRKHSNVGFLDDSPTTNTSEEENESNGADDGDYVDDLIVLSGRRLTGRFYRSQFIQRHFT